MKLYLKWKYLLGFIISHTAFLLCTVKSVPHKFKNCIRDISESCRRTCAHVTVFRIKRMLAHTICNPLVTIHSQYKRQNVIPIGIGYFVNKTRPNKFNLVIVYLNDFFIWYICCSRSFPKGSF